MNDNEDHGLAWQNAPLERSTQLLQPCRKLVDVRAMQHTRAIIGMLDDLERQLKVVSPATL